jgi:hypothetical protein
LILIYYIQSFCIPHVTQCCIDTGWIWIWHIIKSTLTITIWSMNLTCTRIVTQPLIVPFSVTNEIMNPYLYVYFPAQRRSSDPSISMDPSNWLECNRKTFMFVLYFILSRSLVCLVLSITKIWNIS